VKNDRPGTDDFEMLSDEELKACLRLELEKNRPDGSSVRSMLRIVRKRDAEKPQEIPAAVEAVWREFEEKAEKEIDTPKTYKHRVTWRAGKVIAIAAVLCIVVLAVPCAFGSENIAQLVAYWTDDIFRFIRPGETTQAPREYVFQTDHPGLQEIYDTVLALGVTDPVVPMWVPDEYELTELKVTELNEKTKLFASLYNGGSKIVFLIHIGEIQEKPWHEKDDKIVAEREVNRITHYIVKNNEEYGVIWFRDGVECSISTNEEMNTLMDVLDSVYMKR